jgi:AcrR family transcriptional regulator
LPIVHERRERADAARNRKSILDAAGRLFARHGVDAVSLEQVARAAGVGRATLFRRFEDRGALLQALLDERERELQEALLRGPPPLGPGAPAAERLEAFVGALFDLTLEHGELLLGLETTKPLARLRTGAYAAWHQHLALLLAELRPDADARLLADLIVAFFDAELQRFLREERAREPGTVRELILDSVRRLADDRA